MIACAIITMIGIYDCDSDSKITVPGARCYKIASGAAITEWFLTLCFVNYLLALSFCSFHGEDIRSDMLLAVATAAARQRPKALGPPKSRLSRSLTFIKDIFW